MLGKAAQTIANCNPEPDEDRRDSKTIGLC